MEGNKSMGQTVLVTGAAGMVGSTMCPILEKEGHKVYVTDIDTSDRKVKLLDVRDINQVKNQVQKIQPDLVIHLAAETDLEKCELEPEQAYLTNTIGTQNVALVCQSKSIPVAYVSTAGVFDGGKKGFYDEFDTPNPINVYGKSKLEGEKIVERLLSRYYIVRAGWMFGGGRKDKKFVAKIIKQIDDGAKKIYAVTDKLGTPTYTVDFSRCISKLILTGYYGLYHMVCSSEGTRHDVAKKILVILGRSDIQLMSVTSEVFSKTYPVQRPKSEMMRNLMLELRGMNTMRSWEEALYEYMDINFKDRIQKGNTVESCL